MSQYDEESALKIARQAIQQNDMPLASAMLYLLDFRVLVLDEGLDPAKYKYFVAETYQLKDSREAALREKIMDLTTKRQM